MFIDTIYARLPPLHRTTYDRLTIVMRVPDVFASKLRFICVIETRLLSVIGVLFG